MGGGHTGEASRAWYLRDDLFSQDWTAVWQWTPPQCARWVGVIEGLEPYANSFIANEIDIVGDDFGQASAVGITGNDNICAGICRSLDGL